MMLLFTENSNLEHLTQISNESLQNLSSVYNAGSANLTNLNVTGTLTVGNTVIDQSNLTTKGNITTGKLNLPYGDNVLNYGNDGGAWHIYADGANHVIHQGPAVNGPNPNYYFGTNGQLSAPKILTGPITSGPITSNGDFKTNGVVGLGNPGSDYTLCGGPDGFRISTGGCNDTQRDLFPRNPGQKNFWQI